MLDIFNDDAFGVVEMTARVNKLPYVPGQVSSLGVFEEDGVTTTTIILEEQEGNLALVEPTPRGGPGETMDNDKRKVRSFIVPHYQRDDAVNADEVQGVRAFGADGRVGDVETIQGVVDRKMLRHTRSLDATVEHQRVGAIKGVITDKNGKVIYNLYSEYGLTAPAPIDFGLTSDTTKLRQKCFDTIEKIEEALDGNTYTGIHAIVGGTFWKNLIEHKSVKETYLNWVQAAELRGDPMGLRFEFGGIVWERYRTGKKATASNQNTPFIGANEARFIPLGVPELFITRFAPADYIETVNTVGLPRYAKTFAAPNGKRVNLEVQTNAISLCTRPEALFSAVGNT